MEGISPKVEEMHRKAIAALPVVGSKTKALLAAGAAPSTAATQQARTFRSIARNPENAKLLAKGRVSEARLGRKLSALLDAQMVAGKEAVPVPDNAVQFRCLELCLRLGKYLQEDDDAQQAFIVVTQLLTPIYMKHIPPEKHAELAQDLEAFKQA